MPCPSNYKVCSFQKKEKKKKYITKSVVPTNELILKVKPFGFDCEYKIYIYHPPCADNVEHKIMVDIFFVL